MSSSSSSYVFFCVLLLLAATFRLVCFVLLRWALDESLKCTQGTEWQKVRGDDGGGYVVVWCVYAWRINDDGHVCYRWLRARARAATERARVCTQEKETDSTDDRSAGRIKRLMRLVQDASSSSTTTTTTTPTPMMMTTMTSFAHREPAASFRFFLCVLGIVCCCRLSVDVTGVARLYFCISCCSSWSHAGLVVDDELFS